MIAISRVLIIVTLCFYSESNIYTNAPRSGQNTKLTPDAHIAAKMQENYELTSRELKVKCRINVLSKSPSFVFSAAALITLIAWITWTNFGHHNSSYHAQHHSTNANYPSATMVFPLLTRLARNLPYLDARVQKKRVLYTVSPIPIATVATLLRRIYTRRFLGRFLRRSS